MDMKSQEEPLVDMARQKDGSVISLSSGTSARHDREVLSSFGEVNCGEPFDKQHLVLDFMQTVEDTQSMQLKCVNFWNFISEHPELQYMMAFPTSTHDFTKASGDSSNISDTTFNSEPGLVANEKLMERKVNDQTQAVSVLTYVEAKGIINCVFDAKIPTAKICPEGDGPPEYVENEPTSHDLQSQLSPMRQKAKELNTTLRTWDKKHPRSMKEPGRPISLSYSIMQRNKT